MSGSTAERVAVVTASARGLPALTYSMDAGMEANMTCTCPPYLPEQVTARAITRAGCRQWASARPRYLLAGGPPFPREGGKRYGRAPRGQRLVAAVPHGHWKTSTFAGLRIGGLAAPLLIDGAMNGETFRAYIEQVLTPTLRPGDIVILDNLGSHKVTGAPIALTAEASTGPVSRIRAPLANSISTAPGAVDGAGATPGPGTIATGENPGAPGAASKSCCPAEAHEAAANFRLSRYSGPIRRARQTSALTGRTAMLFGRGCVEVVVGRRRLVAATRRTDRIQQ
jgi:DDE superfamily endonuclease